MNEKEAFEQWFRSSKYSQIAFPSAGDVQRAWDSWKAACEWQRSELGQQVVELESNVARRDRDLVYWETVRRELVEEHEKELAALKQQGEPVAEVVSECGKYSVTINHWLPTGTKLFTVPPTCFSAADMADAQAKAFREGRQSCESA